METAPSPAQPEEDGQILADCDRNADANFQLLDAMEAEDDARQSIACSQPDEC